MADLFSRAWLVIVLLCPTPLARPTRDLDCLLTIKGQTQHRTTAKTRDNAGARWRRLTSPPERVLSAKMRSAVEEIKLYNAVRLIGSNRGHATTDTDIRCKSRFETSGEFHYEIPPPTSRSEATVCAVTGGTGPTKSRLSSSAG